jgi:hypothetical protein
MSLYLKKLRDDPAWRAVIRIRSAAADANDPLGVLMAVWSELPLCGIYLVA